MKLVTAIDLVISLTDQVMRLSTMIRQAQSEGLDGLSEAQVEELALAEEEARDALRAAIEAAR